MTTFTYVTVSYYYVGVSYPWVGYSWVGYCDVGVRYGMVSYSPVTYPVVAVAVAVAYCRVGYADVDVGTEPASYRSVTYGAVWCSEMWRRTHSQSLTRGVAVDRIEVQQRGKRERKPQWTSKSTSSKISAATTPQTWQTSWKTSKADPKAPAPAGALPCPQTRPEWPLRRSQGRGGATLPAKACQGLRGPSAGSEGVPPKAGARQAGVCDAGDGPEQLRNVGVAKIPELKM